MVTESRDRLTVAVATTAELAGKQLSDGALKLYAHQLRELPLDAVLRELTKGARSNRLPSIEEIDTAITGKVGDADDAQDTADRIIAAIRDCGSYQSTKAMEAIGPVGAEVVRRFGGWSQVCDVETKELGTFRAQLRDSARSVLARAKAGRLNEPAQLPAPETPRGLTSTAALIGGILGAAKR